MGAPLILQGQVVRLEPLLSSHADGLVRAANDGDLWRSKVTVVPSVDTIGAYIERALGEQALGRQIPFVIVHRSSAAIVGTTRYMNVEDVHRRREIGSTWIAASHQRSAVNTEAKLLMLAHAFEQCGCIRVEFVTDALNVQSRSAITRLGALEEGTFRNHMVMPDGRLRDSVCHSIIASEWPAIKQRLLDRLQRIAAPIDGAD